jgi:membrane protease YdiL (CAAX protease family)
LAGSGWQVTSAPFVYVAALLTVQAGLIATGHVLAGAIADGVLLLLLLNVSLGPTRDVGPERAEAATLALRALAVVALIPVMSVGLPLRDSSTAAGSLVVALLTATAAVLMAPSLSLSLPALLSLRGKWIQLQALLAGILLGFGAYLLGAPHLWSTGASSGAVAVALVAATVVGCVEEFVFRGLVLLTIQRLAPRAGLLAASMLFAASYLSAGSAQLILTIALAGALFGVSVWRSRSLLGALSGHVTFALSAGALWPTALGNSHVRWSHSPGVTIGLAVALAILLVGVMLSGESLGPS